MKILKIKSNGSVTIPARLRKKYGLHLGRKVKFEINKSGIQIIPLVTSEEIKANIGFLGTKGKLLKALMEKKKFEREL
jgi:AbrB family looped-hinge helix DNA binding protein